MRRFLQFVKKEFLHILRDKRTMLILLGIPVLQIILFGFAISTDVKDVRVAIFSPTVDTSVMRLADDVDASSYFDVVAFRRSHAGVDEMFGRGETDIAILLPNHFAARLVKGDASAQIIADATDPNAALSRAGYLSSVVSMSLAGKTGIAPTAAAADIKVKMLHNPQMKSAFNFVPGVMGLILMLLCAMMTSISIVREKETGTMEPLLASPVGTATILVAKAVPYFILSFVNLLTILLLSVTVLKVPVNGSLWLLFGVSLVFILVTLALGLLISCLTSSQVAAMLVSGMGLMMPTMLLSGMIFPLESMPEFLQWISCIIPARWYIDAVRHVMIEGAGFAVVARDFFILLGMAALLLAASGKLLKQRLE